MYIARVEIDLNNRQKTRDLTHVGAFHNWVESCFPHEIEAKERTRKLWRIDRIAGRPYLMIVSKTEPDLMALERYGVEQTGETKNYDAFLNSLEEGMKARFRVTLNPVISRSRPGKRGRVEPIIDVQEQREFLLAQSVKHGFSLEEDEFTIVEQGHEILRKKGHKNQRLIKTTYEGQLTISDLSQFRKAMTEGFGKKKAYGFGLITVIPLRDTK